jgi:hypothetical protein
MDALAILAYRTPQLLLKGIKRFRVRGVVFRRKTKKLFN